MHKVFVNIKIQFWCFISAEMCNFMLFKALWTSLPGVDFFSSKIFSLFSSHALSWQQLHSKLIPDSMFCLNISWKLLARRMICSCTLHTPTQHSSDDTQFRKNREKHTFLLDLIHLHFTWENCDDNTEFLPFSCPLSLFCFYF